MARPAVRRNRVRRTAAFGAVACVLLGGVAATALVITRSTEPGRQHAVAGRPPAAGPASRTTRHPTGLAGTSPRSLGTAGTAGHGQGTTAWSGQPVPASAVTRIPPGTSLDAVHPVSGGTYAFKRGATYTGTLNVTADNVLVDSYGSGRYPVFRRTTEGADVAISGNNDYLSHIRLTGQGYRQVPHCGSARTAGYEIGVDISGSHDTVERVLAYGNLYAGVYVEPTGSYATIRHSIFNHVDSLNPSDFGAGAFGILIWGSHNTVNADTFANQRTCSPVYGTDGSGIEIYHGSYNLIEHSGGSNDSDFTELGGRGATSNTYLDNSFDGPGGFLVTRGSGDTADGPVYHTLLIGNVAHGAVVSYDWRPGSGTLLIMKNNHVASLSQDGGFVDAGGTIIGF